MAQDEASKELMTQLVKLSPAVATSYLSYISLFRPLKSDLSNGRALRLFNELIALDTSFDLLCQALDQTVQQISQNRTQSSDHKPLANHNYLKRVLTSIQGREQHQDTSHAISTRPTQQSQHSVSGAILDITDTDWAKE
jgi:hypothetical protein